MKNLHIRLPEPLYQRLCAEAEREQRPAIDLAREAIDHWLAEQQRQLQHDAIQAYARGMAGTRRLMSLWAYDPDVQPSPCLGYPVSSAPGFSMTYERPY